MRSSSHESELGDFRLPIRIVMRALSQKYRCASHRTETRRQRDPGSQQQYEYGAKLKQDERTRGQSPVVASLAEQMATLSTTRLRHVVYELPYIRQAKPRPCTIWQACVCQRRESCWRPQWSAHQALRWLRQSKGSRCWFLGECGHSQATRSRSRPLRARKPPAPQHSQNLSP